MTRQIKGIHHVSAFTSDAKKNYDWVTNILGLRLVKKTVNQDNINMYHLFYSDDEGNPGTEMTYFEFDGQQSVDGTNSIHRASFRVPDDKALEYWLKRFEKYGVEHSEIKERFKIKYIEFYDFDKQNYQLVSDQNDKGVKSGISWKNGPVPEEFGITGLGPLIIKVSKFDLMKKILEEIYGFTKTKQEGNFYLFEVDKGGNGASMIVELDTESPRVRPGSGSIHHLALRVATKEDIDEWVDFYNQNEVKSSGYVDRFYFHSVYARIYPQILIELASDGPGFIDYQEQYENLGEKLALPPKFEPYREEILKKIRPINTVRSNKKFEKEYLGFKNN